MVYSFVKEYFVYLGIVILFFIIIEQDTSCLNYEQCIHISACIQAYNTSMDDSTKEDRVWYVEKIKANRISAENYRLKLDSLQRNMEVKKRDLDLIRVINENINIKFKESEELIPELEGFGGNDTTITTYKKVDSLQQKGLLGYLMIVDIYEGNADLLSRPILYEKLALKYNTDISIIKDLLKISGEEKEKVLATDTITKGYSPFTNVYQDFVFKVDDIAKKESIKTEEKKVIVKRNREEKSKNKVNVRKGKDTLFVQAMQDSLFPHELVNRYDKNSLKKYWDIYLNQRSQEDVSKMAGKEVNNITQIEKPTVKLRESGKVVIKDSIYKEEKEIAASNKRVERKEEVVVPQDVVGTDKDIIEKVLVKEKPMVMVNETDWTSDSIYYFVQIAASRQQMKQNYINSIYKGKDSVLVREEEGWYKYQIAKTSSYSKAQKTLKELDIKGAFIVPYAGKEKLELWKTLLHKPRRVPNLELTGLMYVVQLAATKNKINTSQFESISSKTMGVIREIEEDGWYKYQLVVGPSFVEAKKQWIKIGVSNSFIVAYLDNKKIKMSEALSIEKNNK